MVCYLPLVVSVCNGGAAVSDFWGCIGKRADDGLEMTWPAGCNTVDWYCLTDTGAVQQRAAEYSGCGRGLLFII